MLIERRRAIASSHVLRRGSAFPQGGCGAFRVGFLLLLFLTWAGSISPVAAQTVLSQDEAIRLAFPAATVIERKTAYFDEEELAAARSAAGRGVEVRSGVISYYLARRGAHPLGVAYFDAHRVRTLPQVLMVVVSPQGTVQRIEVLQFSEPPEYRAPDGWLDLFDGRPLSPDLSLKRAIPTLTGATLTADAVTDAARRVLALHRVIRPFGPHPAGQR